MNAAGDTVAKKPAVQAVLDFPFYGLKLFLTSSTELWGTLSLAQISATHIHINTYQQI